MLVLKMNKIKTPTRVGQMVSLLVVPGKAEVMFFFYIFLHVISDFSIFDKCVYYLLNTAEQILYSRSYINT